MMSSPQLTIDLSALKHNYEVLRKHVTPAFVSAVVKANAYGLGVAPVVKALHDIECNHFFTAHFNEALEVRAALPYARIAVLNGFAEDEFAEARKNNIIPVLNSLDAIEKWVAFARSRAEMLPAHIHLDTGMNRLGLGGDEQKRLIANPGMLDGLELRAIMSHLARAEEFDNLMNQKQLNRFKSLLDRLPKTRSSICNSSGIFWGKDFHFDYVRPGVALYGANPTPSKPNPMMPVIEVKAPILQVRNADAKMTVGYGATYQLQRKARVVTIALGYADGYLRSLSSKGSVKIGNFLAPVIGRVSMDLTTIDVTDVPETVAHIGALVTVIGPHRPVDTLAEEAGTIPYEILTSLGERYQRHYVSSDLGIAV